MRLVCSVAPVGRDLIPVDVHEADKTLNRSLGKELLDGQLWFASSTHTHSHRCYAHSLPPRIRPANCHGRTAFWDNQ